MTALHQEAIIEEWLCVHPFHEGKQFIETKWPWGIGVYMERKAEPPDRRGGAYR